MTASSGSEAKYAMFAASVVVFSAMLNHHDTDRVADVQGRSTRARMSGLI